MSGMKRMTDCVGQELNEESGGDRIYMHVHKGVEDPIANATIVYYGE